MTEIERVAPSDGLANATRRLLDALPEWFGIPQANDDYVESARRTAGYVARRGDQTVGVLLLNRHFPEAAEIHLVAVAPEIHRTGVGRALVAAAEADLRRDGCHLLQVKTLGPSRPSVHYDGTREFYGALGFLRVEELLGLWDQNPCLIMVKPL